MVYQKRQQTEDGEVVTEIKKNNAFAVDKNGYIYCKGIKNFDSNSDSFIPYTTEQAVSSAKPFLLV